MASQITRFLECWCIAASESGYKLWISLLTIANVGSTFSELFRYQSVGIGLGVLYRTPIGRVELNFGMPITIRQGDWARKGLQFGIGIDFM